MYKTAKMTSQICAMIQNIVKRVDKPLQVWYSINVSYGDAIACELKYICILCVTYNSWKILKSWLQEKRNCDFCSWPTVDFEYMIKIGDFLTEGNVIMLHKHLDKSVL